jgi:hypothetical protein
MQKRKEVRSFRLDSELLRMLASSAKNRGVGETLVVETILTSNLKSEMYVHAFGFVAFSTETFRAILKTASPDSLVATGEVCGRTSFTLAKELSESNGRSLGFRRFVLEVLSEQARWFRVEGVLVKPERITLYHNLDVNWSTFLKGYLQGAYSVESKERLEVRIGDNFLTLNLESPSW